MARPAKAPRKNESSAPESILTDAQREAEFQRALQLAIEASRKSHMNLLRSVGDLDREPVARRHKSKGPELTSSERARIIRIEIARKGFLFASPHMRFFTIPPPPRLPLHLHLPLYLHLQPPSPLYLPLSLLLPLPLF